MKITILRHGKPTFPLKGSARSKDICNVVQCYDFSGICEEAPADAVKHASSCKIAVCSDLRRSKESARALGFEEIHTADEVFREVALPHFKGGSIKLPLSMWGPIYRYLSIVGFSRNGESLFMAKRRAKAATSKLIELTREHKDVLLVGHGIINHFIAKELQARNWQGPSKPSAHFWDYSVYRYNTKD